MAKTAKKTQEARFIVNLDLAAQDIAKAGSALKMKIYKDKSVLGTILIGQGSFKWKRTNGKVFKRLRWTQLAKILNDHFDAE